MLTRQDQKGIVTNITSFIYQHNGNIINLEQHIDTENRLFFYALENGRWKVSAPNRTKTEPELADLFRQADIEVPTAGLFFVRTS